MPNNIRNQTMFLGTGGTPEDFSAPTLQYPGTLGGKLTVQTPTDNRSRTFQQVGTDSTMSVAPFPGAVAWWADKNKYQVTTTVTTLGRGRVAGVFTKAVPKGDYCFIQTGGPRTVKFVDSPTAAPTVAGLIVIPSATNAKADCLAAGTAATYPALGVSAGVYNAAAAEATVDLDVPETT